MAEYNIKMVQQEVSANINDNEDSKDMTDNTELGFSLQRVYVFAAELRSFNDFCTLYPISNSQLHKPNTVLRTKPARSTILTLCERLLWI